MDAREKIAKVFSERARTIVDNHLLIEMRSAYDYAIEKSISQLKRANVISTANAKEIKEMMTEWSPRSEALEIITNQVEQSWLIPKESYVEETTPFISRIENSKHIRTIFKKTLNHIEKRDKIVDYFSNNLIDMKTAIKVEYLTPEIYYSSNMEFFRLIARLQNSIENVAHGRDARIHSRLVSNIADELRKVYMPKILETDIEWLF
jgi:hypothetical protein